LTQNPTAPTLAQARHA